MEIDDSKMTYDCLIIDAEKLLADSTAEYFNLSGVRTALAYSASDCRDFFRENTAALLLLDINLGDGSGFELCKKLREATGVPILFTHVSNSSATNSGNFLLISLRLFPADFLTYSLSSSL